MMHIVPMMFFSNSMSSAFCTALLCPIQLESWMHDSCYLGLGIIWTCSRHFSIPAAASTPEADRVWDDSVECPSNLFRMTDRVIGQQISNVTACSSCRMLRQCDIGAMVSMYSAINVFCWDSRHITIGSSCKLSHFSSWSRIARITWILPMSYLEFHLVLPGITNNVPKQDGLYFLWSDGWPIIVVP